MTNFGDVNEGVKQNPFPWDDIAKQHESEQKNFDSFLKIQDEYTKDEQFAIANIWKQIKEDGKVDFLPGDKTKFEARYGLLKEEFMKDLHNHESAQGFLLNGGQEKLANFYQDLQNLPEYKNGIQNKIHALSGTKAMAEGYTVLDAEDPNATADENGRRPTKDWKQLLQEANSGAIDSLPAPEAVKVQGTTHDDFPTRPSFAVSYYTPEDYEQTFIRKNGTNEKIKRIAKEEADMYRKLIYVNGKDDSNGYAKDPNTGMAYAHMKTDDTAKLSKEAQIEAQKEMNRANNKRAMDIAALQARTKRDLEEVTKKAADLDYYEELANRARKETKDYHDERAPYLNKNEDQEFGLITSVDENREQTPNDKKNAVKTHVSHTSERHLVNEDYGAYYTPVTDKGKATGKYTFYDGAKTAEESVGKFDQKISSLIDANGAKDIVSSSEVKKFLNSTNHDIPIIHTEKDGTETFYDGKGKPQERTKLKSSFLYRNAQRSKLDAEDASLQILMGKGKLTIDPTNFHVFSSGDVIFKSYDELLKGIKDKKISRDEAINLAMQNDNYKKTLIVLQQAMRERAKIIPGQEVDLHNKPEGQEIAKHHEMGKAYDQIIQARKAAYEKSLNIQ